jgi:hypothetical protein
MDAGDRPRPLRYDAYKISPAAIHRGQALRLPFPRKIDALHEQGNGSIDGEKP